MKVVHLTSVHKSNDVRIFLKECLTLAEAGLDVSIVAPNAEDRVERGVRIYGVADRSKSRVARMVKTVNNVCRKGLLLNADVYHIHDPELLRVVPILKSRGKKVIYDVHEDVPRQIMGKYWLKNWQKKIIAKVFEYFENKMAKKVDFIVAATPTIRDRFLKLNKNTIDVNNFPKIEEYETSGHVTKEMEVCYIGGIVEVRGIKELVMALPKTNIRLNLGGAYSPPGFKDELMALSGWNKVNDLGFLDRKLVVENMKRSVAGIVTLYPLINYLDSLPVKMFEYMASGIPVIASDFPLWKRIIEENNCGICVNPHSPDEIANAINYLVDHRNTAIEMGRNGRKAVENEFNWANEGVKLVRAYNELTTFE